MRAIKTLSPLLVVALTLVFMGSASAQPKEDFNNSGSYRDVDISSSYYAAVDGSKLVVRDKNGNKVFTHSETDTGYKIVEIKDDSSFYVAGSLTSSSTGVITRFDKSGNIVWNNTFTDDYDGYGNDFDDISVTNSYIFVAAADQQVTKIDVTNGQQVNQYITGTTSHEVETTPSEQSFIYQDNKDGIYKVDAGSLTQTWSKTNSGVNFHSLEVDSNGRVYAGDSNGDLLIYNSSGSLLETINVFSGNKLETIATNSNEIIVADNNGNLDSYNISDYSLNWEKDYSTQTFKAAESTDTRLITGSDQYLRFYSYFTLPNSTTVTDESTNLATGEFALSASAGTVAALKAGGAAITGAAGALASWELGIEDWLFGTNDAEVDLWKSDVRSNAITLEDNRKNLLNSTKISEDALYGDAMATAKSKGVQALNNGKTKAEAKTIVENTIEDYYSDVERTVVNGYNNEVLNLQNDNGNAEAIDVKFDSVFKSSFDDIAVTNSTYTLPNGEEIATYEVVDSDGRKIMTLENSNGVGLETSSTADYESAVYVNGSAHYTVIQGIRDTRSNAVTNVNAIIDNIYANYEPGDVNVTEQFSALELTESLSTNYAETGSYNYAAALLARTGQPTNLDSAFNITYKGNSYEGALFASDAVVNGTVEADTTYNGADGNAVFVAQKTDTADLIELNDQFTVNSITSLKDGAELNSTSLQAEDAYQQDITDLKSEINSLEQKLKEATSTGGGTGVTGNFFSNSPSAGLAIVVILILLGGLVL